MYLNTVDRNRITRLVDDAKISLVSTYITMHVCVKDSSAEVLCTRWFLIHNPNSAKSSDRVFACTFKKVTSNGH